MSKYGLDKFYTKTDVVKKCMSDLDLKQYDIIVEPSAGDGAFHNYVEHENKIAYDIEPNCDSIIKQDYLELDISHLLNKKVLVYGNPPFGRNSSLALKFIKKSSEFADTIAFILPKGFKKQSMKDKIPLNFEISKIIDLNDNNFLYEGKDYNVPCVWVILKKTDKVRKKEIKLKPKNFTFTNKENSNMAIRRVGVNAGTAFLNTDVSEQSHYFISLENPKDLFSKINKDLFSSNDTTGPRSISKNELIRILDNLIV